MSWFFKAQSANASEFPFDLQVNDAPAVRGGYGDVRARAVTVGAGMQPTERINLFAYVNQFDMRLRSQNLLETSMDNESTQGALGMAYRWGPTEQTWIKLGRGVENSVLRNYPTLYFAPPFVSVMGVGSEPSKQLSDVQLRHTVDPAPGSRWSQGRRSLSARR